MDYVTVFDLICVLHRGVEINMKFDPEMKFCSVNLESEIFRTCPSPLALSCWRHNGVRDGRIL